MSRIVFLFISIFNNKNSAERDKREETQVSLGVVTVLTRVWGLNNFVVTIDEQTNTLNAVIPCCWWTFRLDLRSVTLIDENSWMRETRDRRTFGFQLSLDFTSIFADELRPRFCFDWHAALSEDRRCERLPWGWQGRSVLGPLSSYLPSDVRLRTVWVYRVYRPVLSPFIFSVIRWLDKERHSLSSVGVFIHRLFFSFSCTQGFIYRRSSNSILRKESFWMNITSLDQTWFMWIIIWWLRQWLMVRCDRVLVFIQGNRSERWLSLNIPGEKQSIRLKAPLCHLTFALDVSLGILIFPSESIIPTALYLAVDPG